MPNGSEAGSGACSVPLPGHMMPGGADAQTEKGFRDWVASVHPVFAETNLADLLIEMGYDRVAVVGAIEVDEEFDIALHEALLTGLPEGTIRFLGTAAEGSSGLRVLQLMVHPVLGATAPSRHCSSSRPTQGAPAGQHCWSGSWALNSCAHCLHKWGSQ